MSRTSLSSVLRDSMGRARDLHLPTAAAAAAFWLFLSIIPASLAIVNILGLVLDQQQVADYLARFSAVFPGAYGQLVSERLNAIAAASPGTGLADAVLVVVSLWTISAACHVLLESLRRAFGVPRRNAIGARALALGVGLISVIVIGVAAAAFAGASSLPLLEAVGELVVTTAALVALYLVGSRGRAQWLPAIAAAGGAAVVLFGLAKLLRVYVDAAPTMTQVYGASAGIVGAMLAAYVGAFAVILGGVVAAVSQECARHTGAFRTSR